LVIADRRDGEERFLNALVPDVQEKKRPGHKTSYQRTTTWD
jgi:hypothetical protein